MKTILLSAAASLMMVGAAAAMGVGNPPPDGTAGVPSRFVVSIPTVDTGSMAYPSTEGTGSNGGLIIHGPSFNPALFHHPDTGGQQMPVGLR